MTKFEVVVGNIGTVYSGNLMKPALEAYKHYVLQSKSGRGRAGHEEVTLFHNGEPMKEHYGRQTGENPMSRKRRFKIGRPKRRCLTKRGRPARRLVCRTRKGYPGAGKFVSCATLGWASTARKTYARRCKKSTRKIMKLGLFR